MQPTKVTKTRVYEISEEEFKLKLGIPEFEKICEIDTFPELEDKTTKIKILTSIRLTREEQNDN
jgi:hypothetical protein